ncbi:MAG TPA: flagellar basal body rod protein FlgC [Caldithrix sp.]|nr:flagellar basal body rod protein FlgC [Caldithrix sp.]
MAIDKLFGALNISSSGLSAQRKRLDTIAGNIANAQTTRTESGEPYRRKVIRMEAQDGEAFEHVLQKTRHRLAATNRRHIRSAMRPTTRRGGESGVKAVVEEDTSEFKRVYDPTHPDADAEGYVFLPNINLISEMVDMISASRSYEANLTAIDSEKKMAKAALDI